ncbi:uncharacterized protein HKW66_Vig0042910 [Vigna angularis]|uniref:Uncharacterized protein n=1 Tax=Phaseolus angularis TaxID=3914 RepID=A0A8T0KZ68_PHAAN|nr:uncharacterized protein HKW66_Vig0042910 [Vigna angularis]
MTSSTCSLFLAMPSMPSASTFGSNPTSPNKESELKLSHTCWRSEDDALEFPSAEANTSSTHNEKSLADEVTDFRSWLKD